MKAGLVLFSLAVMFGLIGVSTWATGHVSIVPVIQGLLSNPSGGTKHHNFHNLPPFDNNNYRSPHDQTRPDQTAAANLRPL